MRDIKVYTTKTCPWCRVTKQYLDDLGESYREVDVTFDRQAAEEMVAVSGQYGVPVTTIDGEVIIGFDRAKFDRLLARSA